MDDSKVLCISVGCLLPWPPTTRLQISYICNKITFAPPIGWSKQGPWEVSGPGWLEADTAFHPGGDPSGSFLRTNACVRSSKPYHFP